MASNSAKLCGRRRLGGRASQLFFRDAQNDMWRALGGILGDGEEKGGGGDCVTGGGRGGKGGRIDEMEGERVTTTGGRPHLGRGRGDGQFEASGNR